MKLNPNTHYTEIEIMAPRYNDQWKGEARPVLIAPWNIGEHNIIWFSKAKHLAGQRYYMPGGQIRSYPTTAVKGKKNGTTYHMHTVPMTDLTPITDKADDDWDKLMAELDEMEQRIKSTMLD